MNDTISTLVKSVVQKESLHDCSVEELQTIARQYPYFTPAQFLLAEKLKSTDENLYKEQIQKLSLYFSNPLWLDYLLNGYEEVIVEPQIVNTKSFDGATIGDEKQYPKTSIEVETPVTLESESEIYESVDEKVNEPQNESLYSFHETTIADEKQEHPEVLVEETPVNIESEPEILEPVEEKINESTENLNAFNETITKEEQQHPALIEESAVNIEQEQEISGPTEETANQRWDQNINSFDENMVEEKQEPPETFIEEQHVNIEAQQEISEPVEEKMNDPLNENSNSFNEPATKESHENIEIPHEEIPINIESESKTTGSPEGEIVVPEISIPSPDLKKEPTETELTFEPYHTVDYFASQGIKFVPEEKPADRFGQQLKSFTEWLKSMKRLPETETVKIPDVALEKKVQQLADHSISEGEVVTETMAEVWLKQGNKEKALEIYSKLSLLNPAKSAYFASLIEQLKNS